MALRFLCGLVLALSLLGNAQVPPANQRPPTFRSRTDLVALEVNVADGNGRPVAGLTAEDFLVFEDHIPQAIAAFQAFDVPERPWPAAWMGTVRQDVVTNDPPGGRVIAILVDDAMMPPKPGAMNAAREAVRAFIEHLGPDDRCALVFTRDSRGAQPFTSDRKRLEAALATLSLGFTGTGDLSESHFAVGALRTLGDLVRSLGASHHFPRALVFVSPGIAIDWDRVSAPGRMGNIRDSADQQVHQSYARELRAILREAARLDVTIHAVNPDGWVAGGKSSPEELLLTLAHGTGGIAVAAVRGTWGGPDQIGRQIARIDAATRTGYLIGYAPAVVKAGNRRTEVRVRRPGLKVRTRSYSEHLTEADGVEADARRPAPETAATAGVLPDAGLPLRVAAVPLPIGTSRDAAVAVVLGVRHPSGARRSVESLSVTTASYDMEGRYKGGTQSTVRMLTADAPGEVAEYEVYSRLQLPPGRYQLRVSVHDPARGQTGSVYTDVDVPDFTKPGLHVAGVLLDAGPTRLKAAPADLFLHDLAILPTAQREFQRGARVQAFARLVQGGHEPLQAAAMRVRLMDAAGEVVRTTSETIDPGRFGESRTADYRFDMDTGGLAPGWYLLALEAALPDSPAERKDITLHVAGD